MTIFPRELIRLPELFLGNFVRWRSGNPSGDLHELSDRAMEDIGLAEPLRRDFDAVKPFWMP